jgi:hypothetical protein
MNETLIIVGFAIRIVAFVLLIRASMQSRIWSFMRPSNGPLIGLSMSEKRRIGRLASSGTYVPVVDRERVVNVIAWQRRLRAASDRLLPGILLFVPGDLISAIGRETLTPGRTALALAVPLSLFSLRIPARRIEAKQEHTLRVNGLSMPDPELDDRAPQT